MLMSKDDGVKIGRLKVHNLMREMSLISKQRCFHAYKKATLERPGIPNLLARGFNITSLNKVWYGDITYICGEGRWSQLAAVIDLCARRVMGWAFSSKPDADVVVKV